MTGTFFFPLCLHEYIPVARGRGGGGSDTIIQVTATTHGCLLPKNIYKKIYIVGFSSYLLLRQNKNGNFPIIILNVISTVFKIMKIKIWCSEFACHS